MEATETKNFELRPLKTSDIFLMSRVIGKIGINNFKRCFDSDEIKKAVAGMSEEDKKNDDAISAVGFQAALEIADVLFAHLPDCEKELYTLLSALSGLKVNEIQDLPPDVFFEMIVEIIKKPEFKDFFKVASKLFK